MTSSIAEDVKVIFDTRKLLFTKKNEDYGCSFTKTGEILKLVLDGKPVKLETDKDHIAYGLITRMLDKIVRYCQLRFTEHEDQVGEKAQDTIGDLGVYSFMLQAVEEARLHSSSSCSSSSCYEGDDINVHDSKEGV